MHSKAEIEPPVNATSFQACVFRFRSRQALRLLNNMVFRFCKVNIVKKPQEVGEDERGSRIIDHSISINDHDTISHHSSIASSRPQWAREGVYLVYGTFATHPGKFVYEEDLESTINRWRFASLTEYGSQVVAISFISVDNEKEAFNASSPYPYTALCQNCTCIWSTGICSMWTVYRDLFPFYVDPHKIESGE